MPQSQGGKYFSRPADATRDDAMNPIGMDDAPEEQDEGQSVTITKKPDGSFCTESGGDVQEHPDMASALEALGGAFKQQQDMDTDDGGGQGLDVGEDEY